MNIISIISVVLVLLLNAHLCAADEAKKIIKATSEAYRVSDSFSCDGTITTVTYQNKLQKQKLTIDFSIKLKKPNSFLIHWKSREIEPEALAVEGALWSSGKETYFYDKSFNSYFSFSNPEKAFSFTTGISAGTTYKIPSLFLTSIFSEKNWLEKLKKTEVFRGDNVSTITIRSNHAQRLNVKFDLEISTKNSFIVHSYMSSNKTKTKNDRLEELRKKKANYSKNISKYRSIIAGDINEEDIEDINNLTLARFDRLIKEESARPDYKNQMHTVIEESYKNINTIPLAVEVFTFKLPFGVDFQGNKLEKSMENIE